MTLGEKIIKLRKKYNIIQENLVERLNITIPTLSNLEKGLTYPNIREAIKLV